MRIWKGQPYPLGATWDGRGVNFAVFSDAAERIELCLFDSAGAAQETERIELPGSQGHVRHGYLPDLRPGQLYGLRADGPFVPGQGQRFNINKLLFDPYARAVGRDLTYDDAVYGYTIGDDRRDLSFDQRDSASYAPLGAVVDPAFTWGADARPRRALADMVIYELHVKGFSKLHPGVPESLRGTYAGLASPASIDHLLALGVNTVELLPVHYRVNERFLVDQGLSNYWGYNTLGFFAPDPRLAASRDPHAVVREFKTMVAVLHDAGIGVLLDVVYNHTAEGSESGPTLSFRGLDNAAYYHLADNPRFTYDVTGTGNSFNLGHPRTLQLVTDSLRYWTSEMHVDGFRFDLAPELARQFRSFDKLSPFFDVLLQDPVLADVHLIAEPWDVGEGGYDVGNFPVNWSEWNGRYRDTIRRFWAGNAQELGDFATRLTGSSDLYSSDGRQPSASINFITAHDGFTLADLVSYDTKHNEANKQGNADGTDDNNSWNCGVEGPAASPDIRRLREKQRRNFMVILLLSQGVPMLLGGDELSHSQRGNNNAYCQDNDLAWLNWDLDDDRAAFLNFTRDVISLRASEPVFRRQRFFQGRAINGGIKDLYWLNSTGREMQQEDWNTGWVDSLGLGLVGDEIDETDERGEPIVGGSFLILLNASTDPVHFVLPDRVLAFDLRVALDTEDPSRSGSPVADSYDVAGHSVAVIRARRD
jgi:glycogen operon protein